MRPINKVFGIGFHKTGTTSLANALYTLGYNVTGFFAAHDPSIPHIVHEQARHLADRFDAAQDTPWYVIYKDLDQWYPGSKFILTVRSSDRWIESIIKHFKDEYIPAHEWIYGVRQALGNEDVYISRYEAHNREVIEYFKDRPNDLLVMDITAGDGWEKLCPFLGLEIPPFHFPTQNVSQRKSYDILRRGARYLRARLFERDSDDEGSQMRKSVSTEFLRDILHYHYSMFTSIWNGVEQISNEQFSQRSPRFEASVCDFLMRQITEELAWYQQLTGDAGTTEPIRDAMQNRTKESVFRSWDQTRLLMRQHAADLIDETCNKKIPSCNKYIWEVYIHILNVGTQHRALIRGLLQEHGVPVKDQTIIDFYH